MNRLKERKTDQINTYNAVFFKKEMFQKLEGSAEITKWAYKLIDIKWRIYHEISEKGTEIEKQAKERKLAPFEGYQSGDKKRMFNEVVKKYDDTSAYKEIKYRQQRDIVKSSEEKSLKESFG